MSVILNIVFFCTLSYIFFYLIFFYVFSVVYVDTLIAISILFLFYLIYFFFNKTILNYFILKSKIIFIFFFKLIFLVISIKSFVLMFNKSLLEFLIFKFNGLTLNNLNLNFYDFKVLLLKLFFFNNINNLLLNKLFILDKFNKFNNSIESLLNFEDVNLNNLINNFFLFLLKE
jgi:hypothetical protein